MPTERLSMRRIREVLRLRQQGLTERVIARTLGVSNGVVHGYVRRARLAGLTWPLPEGLDDESLELLLFPAPTAASQSGASIHSARASHWHLGQLRERQLLYAIRRSPQRSHCSIWPPSADVRQRSMAVIAARRSVDSEAQCCSRQAAP